MVRKLGWIFYCLLCPALATPSSPEESAVLKGLFLRVEGMTTVAPAGPSPARAIRRATLLQHLKAGDVVSIPAGSRVAIACSTDRRVELRGPAEWTLLPAGCAAGEPLPAGVYPSLSTENGKISSLGKARVLQRKTRVDPPGRQVPVVLSPRNSATRQARPVVRWTAVSEMLEYQISWEGLPSEPQTIARAAAHCEAGTGIWRELTVCSAPFAGERELPPETTVFLRVGGRLSIVGDLRGEKNAVKVHSLSAGAKASLERELGEAAGLPVDPVARLLLEAAALVRSGLVNDALEKYDRVLTLGELPAVRIAVGDLLESEGLAWLAEREYQKVLDAKPAPETAAAALAGLGRAACGQGLFGPADEYFEKARAFFSAAGLAEDAEEIEAAAAACKSG